MEKRIKLSDLITLGLVFSYGCSNGDTGDKSDQVATNNDPVAPALELYYLDPRNADFPVRLTTTSFPDDPFDSDAGKFVPNDGECGAPIEYIFQIKNTGNAPLESLAPVSITKITDYTGGITPCGVDSDYAFTITTPPTFPVAAGASTSFTMTFTRNNALACNYPCSFLANDDENNTGTIEKAQLRLQTNDPSDQDYLLDLTIFGASS